MRERVMVKHMGLKKRLVVAFLILLLVPCFLIGVSMAAVFKTQQESMEHGRYVEDDGSVVFYLVRNTESNAQRLKLTLFQTVFYATAVIVITAICLVIWLYRSIISPLNKISEGTKCLREGNLDFSITSDSEDELGQLCEDFEEMRIHLKEQTEARLKYEKDIVELISNISHDLKTPLTAIKGYSEGILDGVADTKDKQEKYVKTIYTKACDMQVLVDELSFYSKIDSDILPYNFENLDIASYFEDCVEEMSLDMEVKNIKLTYENHLLEQQYVVADAEQLRRVVNNIIGNSIKYMGKSEGNISIKTKDADSFVRVEIEDDGSGIDKADLPHVFERFYRADASRNSKKGGTGLGLAIAAKIIEDHGGSITAESTKGEGTKIIFSLQKSREGAFCDEIEDAEYVEVKSSFVERAKEKYGKNLNN